MTTPTNGATTPAPSNGVKPQTPTQPANPPPEADARAAQLDAREKAIAAREAKYSNELKKNADEKRGLGAKLSEYEQLKKWKAEELAKRERARVNPGPYAAEIWGEKWHDLLNQTVINGVPPAALIEDAFSRLERKFEDRLAERDRQTREQTTAAEAESIEETRAMVANGATQFYEASAKDYPVFEQLGNAARIGQILGQRIETEFMRSGKMLSAKEAADALESEMLAIAESAVKHEKYKSKLHAETKPANVSASKSQDGVQQESLGVQRRTLGNHLTASTTERTPPRSDDERLKRATEVFNTTRAKSTG